MTANFKGRVIYADGNRFDGRVRLVIDLPPGDLERAKLIGAEREAEILVRWRDDSPAAEAAEAMPEVLLS